MKRPVQILLLFACSVSLFAEAREETMEERKRRITRKYLQKRMEITYSDTVVPDTTVEAEEVLASEKFKDPQVDLQRQEPGARMPPPSPPRPRPRAANPNWLLADETETEDPYANPFARKEAKDKPKKKTDWTAWGAERESSPYSILQRDSRFNWSGYDSKRDGLFGSQRTSAEGVQTGFESKDPASDGRGLFGRQQGTQAPYSFGRRDLSRDKTVDPSAQNSFQSPFQSSFLRSPAQSTDQSSAGFQRQQQGYTPYKSPYQTQRDQRKEQWGSYTKPEKDYRKQDPFQQWKEQNPQQFDPMRDDAFINELMPKPRR